MSTNSECEFVEKEPDQWFYTLEDYNAPKNSWDWRDYSETFGPFPTFEVAHQHLHDNHANPGGYSVKPHKDNTGPPLLKAMFPMGGKK